MIAVKKYFIARSIGAGPMELETMKVISDSQSVSNK